MDNNFRERLRCALEELFAVQCPQSDDHDPPPFCEKCIRMIDAILEIEEECAKVDLP